VLYEGSPYTIQTKFNKSWGSPEGWQHTLILRLMYKSQDFGETNPRNSGAETSSLTSYVTLGSHLDSVSFWKTGTNDSTRPAYCGAW
jgi:hypothetical protein